jgi:type IV secretion system coupling TraD/TrwB family protein
VGQARSTIDPSGWLSSGAIVVVNTAKGTVGEDTAALIGGTLINFVGLPVSEQVQLPESRRRPVTLIVDELQTMPGADYEAILSELAKYGANLILATQSLARLEALNRDQGRSLRATVFANLDGLFAFHTSAEDAAYLVRELGDEIDERDLIELGEHQCYAKLSAGGERLPTFSVSLDPPPAGDSSIRDALAAASATRYGREAAAVDADLRSALARIEAIRGRSLTGGPAADGAYGGDQDRVPDEATTAYKQVKAPKRKVRSKHRRGNPTPSDVAQMGSPDRGQESTPAEAPAFVEEELPQGRFR